MVDLTSRGPRDDADHRLWDLGIAQWAVEVFVQPTAGHLLGPDRQELLILPTPRSGGRSIIAAPLIPAVFGTAYEHDDLTPFGITAPAEPIRAAALIERRLLPQYADALAAITTREVAAYTPSQHELAGDSSAQPTAELPPAGTRVRASASRTAIVGDLQSHPAPASTTNPIAPRSGAPLSQHLPRIHLHRDEVGMVSAIGATDALAVLVLQRAGFVDTGVFNERWHRLPFDLGEATENTKACHAASMLIHTGFEVELDPHLRRGVQSPAGARPYAGAPGLALSRLTEQLATEPDEDLQRLQRFVLERTHGIPDQISTMLATAADRIDSWNSGNTDLVQQFRTATRIAGQVGAVLDDLLTTPDLGDRHHAPYTADPRLALARDIELVGTTASPRMAARLVQRAVLERGSGALDQLQEFLELAASRCEQYEPDPGQALQRVNALRAATSARSAAQLLPEVRHVLTGGITVLGRLQPVRRNEAAAPSGRHAPSTVGEPPTTSPAPPTDPRGHRR
ncbi:hypothetical protein [Streptacidiphilus sp. BW17]|uniref:hypothetical protein n=1 Tax=Streptacidiphilus sp. BW17 TaxID=3156274 RepID=UPI0035137529